MYCIVGNYKEIVDYFLFLVKGRFVTREAQSQNVCKMKLKRHSRNKNGIAFI